MEITRILGIAGVVCGVAVAASAADVKVSDLPPNAQVSKLVIGGKRTANGPFAITAIPARLNGVTMVAVPRGAGASPGAAYSVSIDSPATVYMLVQARGKVTVPEGWTKVPGGVEWVAGNSRLSDTVYMKQAEAGKVEVPAHDGKDGNSFGVPNALVISDRNLESDAPAAVLGILDVGSRMRTANGAFIIREIPDNLKKLPMVSVPRGAGNQPGAAYSFILDKPAKVYLLVQDRGTVTLPDGWEKQEGKVTWTTGDTKFSDNIYRKSFAAGEIEVPAHDGKQATAFGIPNAIVIQYE